MSDEKQEGVRATAESPEDECVCGDARRQHRESDGQCVFNKGLGSMGHGGAADCNKFTLWRAALSPTIGAAVKKG